MFLPNLKIKIVKKLSRNEMKSLIGGKRFAFASCGVECSDGVIHTASCGTNDCNTTTSGQVECSNPQNGTVISTVNPCASVKAD